MAQSLSCRMSRLVVSSRQFMSTQSVTATSAPSLIAATRSPKFGFFPKMTHHGIRCLSSAAAPARTIDINSGADFGATSSLAPILSLDAAENFAAFAHANRHQKVKPFILKRRREKLRKYLGNERNIRHSPWRLNLVCQFAAGLTVPEALKQLMFCQKVKAPLVAKVIRRTANLADIRHGLQPSQLEVAECFSTHGTHLKRVKIMGRGRAGKKFRRHSHIRLVLREIDFPTKLLQAESINQKRKWLGYLKSARDDYDKAKVERDELAELEAMAAELEEEARKKREEEGK